MQKLMWNSTRLASYIGCLVRIIRHLVRQDAILLAVFEAPQVLVPKAACRKRAVVGVREWGGSGHFLTASPQNPTPEIRRGCVLDLVERLRF